LARKRNNDFTRREFVSGILATSASSLIAKADPLVTTSAPAEKHSPGSHVTSTEPLDIDFRYSPRHWQTAICFPDDQHKSLVGQAGDLRYGFTKNNLLVGMEDFATVCTFSLAGMQDDHIERQWIESASTPIVHTLIDRPTAHLELIAFASRHENEGRVDNVLMIVTPKKSAVAAMAKIHIATCETLKFITNDKLFIATEESSSAPFFVAAKLGDSLGSSSMLWEEAGYTAYLAHGEARPEKSLRYLVRFPQEGQSLEQLAPAFVDDPDALLAASRDYWKRWQPFESVRWSYPERHGEFLTACARNIQQAREQKDGRLVFQVGPTVYRGLWIVDGNFLLEAARYLGYDKEADQGLRAEWAKQLPTGQIIAAVPGEHWKDTAIAMFTLVRQCELKQDWSDLRELEPHVRKAIEFLRSNRDQARAAGDSTNGKYGLLAPGFADGGISGVRSEFTNTVWTLAGLKAVARAAQQQKIPSLDIAGTFYSELREAFRHAARAEMVEHAKGFRYLPMLAHDDAMFRDPDPWNRPRPQSAQWALSHAIFPGEVFDRSDPIVQGQIALLQSCTREDIPAETGWLWHEALWNYNASFAAHVYLWAGHRDWAARTFAGFLNHASSMYCWREEQPLQDALVGQDWGDMPHNWASAECVRYLRHMLVLEDASRLRLLEGVTQAAKPYSLQQTPTRFGRIDLAFEPAAKTTSVKFAREGKPTKLDSVELPQSIAKQRLASIEGTSFKSAADEDHILVDPQATRWTAIYR
jgi:hypothetical protein